MKKVILLAAFAVFMVAPSLVRAGDNYTNGSCFTSESGQFYFRSYSGDTWVGETGICDEPSGDYTYTSIDINGYTVYVSQYNVDWAYGEVDKGNEVYVIYKTSSGEVINIGRYR